MSDKFIFSIGHGGRKIEDFFSLLKENEIKYLVDVRSYPYSKYYPEYNKENIDIVSKKYDIKYVFMGDSLGGRPNDRSCYSDDKDENGKAQVLYNEIKKKDFFIHSIERLVVANSKKLKVACMCSELNPCDCHRSKLIGEVLYNDKNIVTYHIDENGLIQTQNDVINILTKGSGTKSLFDGEIEFKSIGSY